MQDSWHPSKDFGGMCDRRAKIVTYYPAVGQVATLHLIK